MNFQGLLGGQGGGIRRPPFSETVTKLDEPRLFDGIVEAAQRAPGSKAEDWQPPASSMDSLTKHLRAVRDREKKAERERSPHTFSPKVLCEPHLPRTSFHACPDIASRTHL